MFGPRLTHRAWVHHPRRAVGLANNVFGLKARRLERELVGRTDRVADGLDEPSATALTFPKVWIL